jgi:CRP/FNR family cyclic AMP-dependent transcriptional regulator
MADLVQILKQIELFQGLDEGQLHRLAEISQREVYKESDVIFNQDDAGNKMYIISDGQVEVIYRPEGGEDRTMIFLGQGQVFGEMALLDEGSRSASVVAVQDNTEVYALPRSNFNTLCKTDTALGYQMMRNLALDLSFKLRHRNSESSTS